MSHARNSPEDRRPAATPPAPVPRLSAFVVPLALSLGLGLMATAGTAASAPLSPDPYEGFNRAVYNSQRDLDRAVLRPLSVFYRHAVPSPVRAGLKGVSANLGEPGIAANDLLQGRHGAAGRTVVRFVANSTIGLGGIFDVAAKVGLPHHDNDLGLTLARRGVKPGPYLFLPFVGPTNVRDGAATLVSAVLNPLTYVGYPGQTAVSLTTTTTGGLQTRADVDADLKSLDAMAVDPYATLRAFAQQRRASDVRGGIVEVESLPDFDDGPAPGQPAVTTIALATPSQGDAP